MSEAYDDIEPLANETDEVEDRGDDFEPVPDDELPEDSEVEASAEEDGIDEGEEVERENKAIPQSRFNEVNQRYKEEREERLRLEEENARLKALSEKPDSQGEAPPVDLDALEDEYDEAILEGDTATARALRKQIRQVEREHIEQQAMQAAQRQFEEREQAMENQRLAQVAAQVTQKYPAFDGQSEQADPELIEMVLSYRDRLIIQGRKPSDALALAAEKVAARSLQPLPSLKPVNAPKVDAQKHLSREAQIPARTSGSRGARSQAVDYASLSDAEFSRLSEEDLRRARGDFL